MNMQVSKKGSWHMYSMIVFAVVAIGALNIFTDSDIGITGTSSSLHLVQDIESEGSMIGPAFIDGPTWALPALNECQVREFQATFTGDFWRVYGVCHFHPGQGLAAVTYAPFSLDLYALGKVEIHPNTWRVGPDGSIASFTGRDARGNLITTALLRYDLQTGFLSFEIKGNTMIDAPFTRVPLIHSTLHISSMTMQGEMELSYNRQTFPEGLTNSVMMTLR